MTAQGDKAGTADTLAGNADPKVSDGLRTATVERFAPVQTEHYEILGELARGGLGRIYRARDARTGRIVAIKEVLHPEAAIVLRFAREALVTANLQHPSIVPVYEVGRWPDGEPFYAMKLVRGRTLEDCIVETRTLEERIALVPHVIDVADALAYAHSEHVIHRDLKPANVLVGAYGETVVIDWGLAKNVATGDELGPAPSPPPVEPGGQSSENGWGISADGSTVAGVVLGTPAYMAPEQAVGAPLDERTDVYAIGAILYHVLAGRWPYAGRPNVVRAVVDGAPTPLAALAPEAPPELVAIAEKAMARMPHERYPSAESLAQDLRRFLSGQLVGAHRYTAWQLIKRWVKQHRAVVLTVAVAVVALAVAAVIGVREVAAERDEAQAQRTIAERERGEAQAQRTIAERERGEAQAQRKIAEERHAESLVELGRQALVEPNLEQALPYLVRAAELGPDEPARSTLALLIGRARAAYRGLIAVAPGHLRETTSAVLTADGALITSGQEGAVRAWDLATRQVRWQVDAPEGERRIALSPDGRWLLGIAGDDGVVVRSVDGRVHRRWRLPPRVSAGAEHVGELAWASDSARFALGTSAGRVVFGSHDVDGELALGVAHDGAVGTLVFGPATGREEPALASIGADGVIIVQTPRGERSRRLVDTAAEAGPLSDVAWLDADHLVSGGDDGVARLWDVREGRVARRYAHGTSIIGVTLSAAGSSEARWLATYGAGEDVILWDVDTGTERARLGGHRIGIWRVLTVGDALLSVDESNRAFVWDPQSGERLRELPGDPAGKDVAVFDERLVVYGRGRSFVWRLRDGHPARGFESEAGFARVFGHTARVRDLAFSPDGATLWSASSDGTARNVDVSGRRAPIVFGTPSLEAPSVVAVADAGAQIPSPHGLLSVRPSDDGRVVVGSEEGWIAVIDAQSGAELVRFEGHTRRARRVVFARDGLTAYSVGDTTLRRWELATGRELARVDLGAGAWDVALLTDGAHDLLVTLTADAAMALWDAETVPGQPGAAPLGTFTARPSQLSVNQVRDLVVSGDRFVSATHGFLAIVDGAGRPESVVAHERVFSADIWRGPAGIERVAVGDSIGQVVIYDGSLTPLHLWRADRASAELVTAVQFRPDGKMVASSSGRRVRIWTLSGGLVAETPELPALILHLVWSPDGSRLAIAGGSGTIWLWDLGAGSSEGLAAFVRCVSHWTLSAVPGAFDSEDCTALEPLERGP